jgi:hypothetical protein
METGGGKRLILWGKQKNQPRKAMKNFAVLRVVTNPKETLFE